MKLLAIPSRFSRPVAAVSVAMALLVVASGCTNPFAPRVGTSRAVAAPAPRPTSPRRVMELLKWCWENRAIAEYEELFTEDFRFAFAAADSADNPPILRDEEIEIARRLFTEGAAGAPRANRIEYIYQSALVPIPDTRPGMNPIWHQEVQTSVILHLTFDDGSRIDVESDVNFFLVRGDSARIPEELVQRGFTADPNRWYIERWEEKTAGGAAFAPLPPAELAATSTASAGPRRGLTTHAPAAGAQALPWTLGRLKRLYRDAPF